MWACSYCSRVQWQPPVSSKMVSIVDVSPTKSNLERLAFHFEAKVSFASPSKTSTNVDSAFLTWSDERRRPPTPPHVNSKVLKKNDIRKYFAPVDKSKNVKHSHNKKGQQKRVDNCSAPPTLTSLSIRSKYSRYTEIIPPRERRTNFNDDSSSSDDEDKRNERSSRRDSRSRSRSPVQRRRTSPRNRRRYSRGIMFSADDLTNLVPPTSTKIKGLSKYKPIEMKTFASSYVPNSVKNVSKRVSTNRGQSAKSIFEIKALSLE